MGFEEGEEPENPGKNPLGLGQKKGELIASHGQELNPSHIGERSECFHHCAIPSPPLGFAVVVFLISLVWLVNPNVTCTFCHKDKLLKG